MNGSDTYYQDPQEGAANIPGRTGRKVQVIIGRIFSVDILIDPGQTATRDDRFLLRSTDGEYEETRTISDDKIAGDGRCTLEFTHLLPGRKYTLLHEEGADGVTYVLFQERTYADLFGGLHEDADAPSFDRQVDMIAFTEGEQIEHDREEEPAWLENVAPAADASPDFLT